MFIPRVRGWLWCNENIPSPLSPEEQRRAQYPEMTTAGFYNKDDVWDFS